MVVQDGRVIASWGDVSRKVNVASVCKSLLSALYGIAVGERRIDLGSTLADFGIDDKCPALTATERRATIRDLLMARSGVYQVAAYETADIRHKRPERGSHAPGTFWFYNNWDFSAIGTIYRQQTGEDIFQSFSKRIALPVGMEDFSVRDCSYSLAKNLERKHALWRGRIDRIADRTKMDTTLLEIFDHLQKVADRPGKAIQPDDNQHVAGGEVPRSLVRTGRARDAPEPCS